MNYCNVSDQIFQSIRSIAEHHRKPIEYEGGILLSTGEVQFLQTIISSWPSMVQSGPAVPLSTYLKG